MTKEQEFWDWFTIHEAELFNFNPENELEREELFDKLEIELHKVHPKLTFEFGPNDTKREFVISAGGFKSVFPAVVSLVNVAPHFERWRVIAFRPRRIPNIVEFGGKRVDPRDVQFTLLDNGKNAGIYLFIPGLREDDFDLKQIGYLLLDETLGEYDVESRLGPIEMLSSDAIIDAADDADTGSRQLCEDNNGGKWVNPEDFENAILTNGQAANIKYGDWSGQANSTIASSWLNPSTTVNGGPWSKADFLAYGAQWALGTLPTQLQYGPNDAETVAMINRPYVQGQLAAYKQSGCPANAPAAQDSISAYKETRRDAMSGHPNYVQAEVGGYSGNISTSGGVTTVTLTNVSGISSFVGYSAAVGEVNKGLGTHLNRNTLDTHKGPGRNVTQTFTWSEPSPCS